MNFTTNTIRSALTSLKGITTRNAVLVLAGAVLVQPFVSKALDEANKYASQYEADQACEAWQAKGDRVITPGITKTVGVQPWKPAGNTIVIPAVIENYRSCRIERNASKPHVAGWEEGQAIKRFYF